MKTADNESNTDDPFSLSRFISAQNGIYERVLSELKNGQKTTHWMWFVFPQLDGLGFSATSKFYSVKSIGEAQMYLQHPVLGMRLRECAGALLSVEGRTASEIFGYPDDMKLQSSMTLFAYVSLPDSLFSQVLEKYFQGKRDAKTLRLCEMLK